MVGSVYRPPEQRDFIEPFEEFVSKIRSDVAVLILGVFNICFRKANTGKQAHLFKMYSDVLNISSFNQLIKNWKRVTVNSSSIIDNILCNTPSNQHGTMPIGLSDHFLILFSENCQEPDQSA